ncbi:Diphthine methyltransferase [Linum grandiflorum]
MNIGCSPREFEAAATSQVIYELGLVFTNFRVGNSIEFQLDSGMELGSCHLDGNADAVEFCPHDNYHHVLAAATYNLQESDPPTRSGSISLFQVDPQKGQFELFHRVETTGIFDIKWNPVRSNAEPLLGQADADGYLRIRSLHRHSDEPKGCSLEEVSGKKISSAMCLWLDWNPSATSISVGLSDGSVSVVSISESQLEVVQEWKAHDFEVWAASFDIHQPHLVYTGSDDCKFRCWDIRASSNMVFQNSKEHKMGVCCIAKSPSNPNTLLTGSYDEYLRMWDVRSISKPVNQVSVCLGGGVWRLKHHPFVPDVALAACMHNGFAVVKIKEEGGAEVLETYDKHESLAYGADWQRGGFYEDGSGKRAAVATCSFYDKLLRAWIPRNTIA